MPNWKKVIVSGSNAILNSLTSSNGVVITGSLVTTGSNTLIGNTSLTGSLNISGSTTQIGSNNLLGNTTLSGSIIISGSTTVPTVQVYGNVTHDGYIRFNPVSTNLDTTISASYIYVSGSTQDLYFSQNSKGYNNVTRLRWIEGTLYTGLLHGGVITSQSSTVYQVSSGSGIIVDLNASLSDDPYPTIQYLEWSNLSASINAFTASHQQCFVGIDSTNNIFAQADPFTNSQFNTIINIGNVLFQNQTSINAVKTQPSTAYGFIQAQNIFNRAFGPLKLSGFTLSPSGSSTGSLVVGSGTAYSPGADYVNDPNEPYYVNDTGTNISKIFRYRQSGSTWVYDTNAGAGYAAIDPTRYSNNGVLTAVPAPANQNWTIQRVFYFPSSPIKAIVVYYGNAYYGSESEALANIAFESFIEAPDTAANAIYLGAIVINGTGVFTNAATFTIYPSGLFRQVGGSGGGGSTVTTTLAGLSDVNISAPTDGQALVYNNAALKWENKSFISASISGNAATATTASFANTASYVLNAVSSSFASTASYLNTLNQDLTFNGNLTLNGTASISFLNVTYESASIIYSSGSNQLGDATNDTQTLIGRTIVSGSFEVTGSTNIPNITGSLLGTASYATQALSSSFATTASYVLNAISSSFAPTASYVNPLNQNVIITGSLTVITGSNIELQVLNTGVRLGNIIGDAHTVTGSLGVSGSSNFNGNLTITGSASNSLLVKGSGTTNATNALRIENSAGSSGLIVNDVGKVAIGTNITPNASNAYDLTTSYIIAAYMNNNRYDLAGVLFGSYPGGGIFNIGESGWTGRVNYSTFNILSNVGINKTSPNANLDVSGSVIITGSLTVMTGSNVELQVTNTGVKLGNASTDTHTATGSFNVSGSFNVIGQSVFASNPAGTVGDVAQFYAGVRSIFIRSTNNESKLHVNGNTQITGSSSNSLLVKGSGATSATNALRIENSNASASFTVRDDGLVSVMPNNANITIDGSTSSGGRIIIQNPTSNALIGINSYNTFLYPTELVLFARSTIKGYTNALGDLRFYNLTTGKTYMFMTETGLISVNKGTVTPNADLDVSGSVIITGSLTVITGSNIEFRVLNTGVRIGNVIGDVHTVTGSFSVSGSSNFNGNTTITGSLIVSSSNVTQFLVGTNTLFADSSNNVGIGTTSPSERLHIAAAGNGGDVPLFIRGSNTKGGANYLDFLYVDNTGGGSNPKKYFRIDGNGSWEVINNAYTQVIMSLDDTGNMTIAGTLTQNSDASLKTNIQTIPNALEKTLQLRGVEYDRIGTNKHEIGLIAQEVEQVLPELVSETNGIKSVAYSNVVSILVESIKELKQEIDTLREQINKK